MHLIIGFVAQVTLFAGVAALMQYGFLNGGETLATGFVLISLLLVLFGGHSAGMVCQRKYRAEIKPLTKVSSRF